MAREGAGDIPSNGPGQGTTSSSTHTHVQGAYGAPTGAVEGAAERSKVRDYCTIVRAPQMDEALLQLLVLLLLRKNSSQHVLASAVIASARRGNAHERRWSTHDPRDGRR